jgi:hypothetical protein
MRILKEYSPSSFLKFISSEVLDTLEPASLPSKLHEAGLSTGSLFGRLALYRLVVNIVY